jgi:hypothetical protein
VQPEVVNPAQVRRRRQRHDTVVADAVAGEVEPPQGGQPAFGQRRGAGVADGVVVQVEVDE